MSVNQTVNRLQSLHSWVFAVDRAVDCWFIWGCRLTGRSTEVYFSCCHDHVVVVLISYISLSLQKNSSSSYYLDRTARFGDNHRDLHIERLRHCHIAQKIYNMGIIIDLLHELNRPYFFGFSLLYDPAAILSFLKYNITMSLLRSHFLSFYQLQPCTLYWISPISFELPFKHLLFVQPWH